MTQKTALICDDDRMIARISKLILTQRGFKVLEATDGEAGLAMILSERPGLVLLDLQMPKKDGVEVLAGLKSAGHTGSYIVVLSAEDKAAIDAKVLPLGAHESMSKPFAPVEFGKKIDALVKEGKIS
jgi:DNA-binding response OmpR family regulator